QTGAKLLDGTTSRKKTGNKWFETQDQIGYHEDFEKEKIIYPNMTKFFPFCFDETGLFSNDKSFIISGQNLKYLVGVFNSRVAKYWIENNCPELLGGTRELRKIFFKNFPVPEINNENKQ